MMKEVIDLRTKKKESVFLRMRKSVILCLKDKLEDIDVKIMTHVLTVVLMVAIIAATVAWFVFADSVNVKGMYLKSSLATDVEISLDKDNWSDIAGMEENKLEHTFENAVSMVDVVMPAFQNIYDEEGNQVITENSGIIAPGTYGSFSFFVKLVNESCDSCILNISRILDSVAEESKNQEITKLFQGHILCFVKVEGESSLRYAGEDSPVEIPFESFQGESAAKQITVYWVWPYEYKDVSAETVAVNGELSFGETSAPANIFKLPDTLPESLSLTAGDTPAEGSQLAANQIFEWERYTRDCSAYAAADDRTKEKLLTEWYDYGDTLIGSYVENMVFHIEVRGVLHNED